MRVHCLRYRSRGERPVQPNWPCDYYCYIVPRCLVTFWTHPEIIPLGQFFRRWIQSINQSINQERQQIPTTMVEALRSRAFRLVDWLTITLTWLIYWIRTTRSIFTGAGLKWQNTAGQYSVIFIKTGVLLAGVSVMRRLMNLLRAPNLLNLNGPLVNHRCGQFIGLFTVDYTYVCISRRKLSTVAIYTVGK